jgi:hypothetical protein
MAIGQAAGTAAALAVATRRQPRAIDVKALQRTLVHDGASLRRNEADAAAEQQLARNAVNAALAEGRISRRYLADASTFSGRAPRL